jgi:hypothetical protein
VKNLPSGTQEGLLQQALEKYTDIKRVEVFNDKNEAIIELASVAVSLQHLGPSGIGFSRRLFIGGG